MAATGKTPILLYGSTTATNQPSAGNLTNNSDGCEIAINVTDKNLFFKDNTNTVNTVPLRQASASSNGWLSSTDWSTFNSKQPAGSYAVTNAGQTFNGVQTIKNDGVYGAAQLIIQGATNTNQFVLFGYATNADYGYIQPLENGVGYRSLYLCPSAGNVYIGAGNLVMSTSGTGIDFSATAGTGTSELLADYEEGTWTPRPTAPSGSFTTYTSSGYYTKVGNMVCATFSVQITNVGTATNMNYIADFPFTSGSSISSCAFREGTNTGIAWTGTLNNSATAMVTFTYANAQTVANNASFTGCIVYRTS